MKISLIRIAPFTTSDAEKVKSRLHQFLEAIVLLEAVPTQLEIDPPENHSLIDRSQYQRRLYVNQMREEVVYTLEEMDNNYYLGARYFVLKDGALEQWGS